MVVLPLRGRVTALKLRIFARLAKWALAHFAVDVGWRLSADRKDVAIDIFLCRDDGLPVSSVALPSQPVAGTAIGLTLGFTQSGDV